MALYLPLNDSGLVNRILEIPVDMYFFPFILFSCSCLKLSEHMLSTVRRHAFRFVTEMLVLS
jgi:hypothetical protein